MVTLGDQALIYPGKNKQNIPFKKTSQYMSQEELGAFLFRRATEVLGLPDFKFQPMRRKTPVKSLKSSFRIAYINPKTKKLVLDIYTPRTRKPKKPSVILRTIAHELAHVQKPPYKQLWRGKVINRAHYPNFYKQVNKNIERFKKDRILGQFFT